MCLIMIEICLFVFNEPRSRMKASKTSEIYDLAPIQAQIYLAVDKVEKTYHIDRRSSHTPPALG